MKKFLAILGLGVISAGAAQAAELDACTTFTDAPPGLSDQLLCDKEKQHAEELGLGIVGEKTVFTLSDLYGLGWALHSVERFRNANGAYVYRVYIVREKA